LIVVDASALAAIALPEPDRPIFEAALQATDGACISAINYVEIGTVLVSRRVFDSKPQLDAWLSRLRIDVKDDVELGRLALEAYLRYGKGFHPARLNLADCFAYALAKALDAPLLYKGDDFAKTDIRSALQPT
jgi:ribonuclease VapC